MKTVNSVANAVGVFGIAAVIVCMSPAHSRAQGTAEERSACMGDAFKYCGSDIPNVSKIEACLKANIGKLKPACRAEFEPAGRTKLHSSHFK